MNRTTIVILAVVAVVIVIIIGARMDFGNDVPAEGMGVEEEVGNGADGTTEDGAVDEAN